MKKITESELKSLARRLREYTAVTEDETVPPEQLLKQYDDAISAMKSMLKDNPAVQVSINDLQQKREALIKANPSLAPQTNNNEPPAKKSWNANTLGLGMGMQGKPDLKVQQLQQMLHIEPADGRFGPATQKAVIAKQNELIQRGAKIKADGAWGPRSMQALTDFPDLTPVEPSQDNNKSQPVVNVEVPTGDTSGTAGTDNVKPTPAPAQQPVEKPDYTKTGLTTSDGRPVTSSDGSQVKTGAQRESVGYDEINRIVSLVHYR